MLLLSTFFGNPLLTFLITTFRAFATSVRELKIGYKELHCHMVSEILVEGELSAAEQRNRVLSLTTEQVVTAKCV